MGRSKKRDDGVRNAMYRCRELRDSIDWLGAALGPLSCRDLECAEVHVATKEIERQITVLNGLRERVAKTYGFLDEMETPEIVQRLRR